LLIEKLKRKLTCSPSLPTICEENSLETACDDKATCDLHFMPLQVTCPSTLRWVECQWCYKTVCTSH
ncbi:hypothetical protein PENTCL1PPCAC_24355, partial [Pristionchus entomophagus]